MRFSVRRWNNPIYQALSEHFRTGPTEELFRARIPARDQALGGHSGLSAGIGARYLWLGLDYAYNSLGELGAGNIVTLSAQF